MAILRTVAAILVTALCACAPPLVDFSARNRVYKGSDYEKVQGAWTRDGSLYQGVESVFFISGLYKSWDWRQAYIALQQQNLVLSAADRERLERAQRDAAEKEHEVFLSVSMPKRTWQDFDQKESKWRISLVNDRGEEVRPLSISRVKNGVPELTTLYPFHTGFHIGYELRFPRTLPDGRTFLPPGARRLTLRVAGVPGRAELHWKATK